MNEPLIGSRLRTIDDCIEALQDIGERFSEGTLTPAVAAGMIRTVKKHAKLVGDLRLKAAKLRVDATAQRLDPSSPPNGLPAHDVLALKDGIHRFREELKRLEKKTKAVRTQ